MGTGYGRLPLSGMMGWLKPFLDLHRFGSVHKLLLLRRWHFQDGVLEIEPAPFIDKLGLFFVIDVYLEHVLFPLFIFLIVNFLIISHGALLKEVTIRWVVNGWLCWLTWWIVTSEPWISHDYISAIIICIQISVLHVVYIILARVTWEQVHIPVDNCPVYVFLEVFIGFRFLSARSLLLRLMLRCVVIFHLVRSHCWVCYYIYLCLHLTPIYYIIWFSATPLGAHRLCPSVLGIYWGLFLWRPKLIFSRLWCFDSNSLPIYIGRMNIVGQLVLSSSNGFWRLLLSIVLLRQIQLDLVYVILDGQRMSDFIFVSFLRVPVCQGSLY